MSRFAFLIFGFLFSFQSAYAARWVLVNPKTIPAKLMAKFTLEKNIM